jgi:outer membrane scaffolding protein for murein synthesis (MipA/OmpV family)
MNIKRGMRATRTCLIVLIALTLSSGSAVAQEGWDFTAGGSVCSTSVYTGSGDYYLDFSPLLQAQYGMGDVVFSLSLMDGLGVTWVNQEKGFLGSITVVGGEERNSEEYSVLGIYRDHTERTKRLLLDSPTVSTPVVMGAMFGFQALKGIIGATIEYHMIDVDYAPGGLEDTDSQGILYSMFYSIENKVRENLSITATLGVEYMNQDYADAWYSVKEQTVELDLFEADAGLRDAMLALEVTRMFSAHTGMSLLGAGTLLLADAGRSPYTVDRFQPSAMLTAFYNF